MDVNISGLDLKLDKKYNGNRTNIWLDVNKLCETADFIQAASQFNIEVTNVDSMVEIQKWQYRRKTGFQTSCEIAENK